MGTAKTLFSERKGEKCENGSINTYKQLQTDQLLQVVYCVPEMSQRWVLWGRLIISKECQNRKSWLGHAAKYSQEQQSHRRRLPTPLCQGRTRVGGDSSLAPSNMWLHSSTVHSKKAKAEGMLAWWRRGGCGAGGGHRSLRLAQRCHCGIQSSHLSLVHLRSQLWPL